MRVQKFPEDLKPYVWFMTVYDLLVFLLSDACFDWLVGNMNVCQENLFQSKSEKTTIFLRLLNYL